MAMSIDTTRQSSVALFDEVWNTGGLDAIEELYAADYVADYRPYAPLRRGHDAIKDWCGAPMWPSPTIMKSWKR
jgi:hypothetical protein